MDNLKFYDLLLKDAEFKNQLGEAMLLSGKLETVLAKLLKKNGISLNKEIQTLNTIIKKLNEKDLIDKNEKAVLEVLASQRNYLAHCIFGELDNFFEEDNKRIDESMKPRSALVTENLVESDVHTYIEKVWQFNQNVLHMLDIFEKKLHKLESIGV